MTSISDLLDGVEKWPDTCDSGVTRDGEYVSCDKPAVGVRINDDDEIAEAGTYAWPVCAYHVRKGHMVALRDLLAWQGRR